MWERKIFENYAKAQAFANKKEKAFIKGTFGNWEVTYWKN